MQERLTARLAQLYSERPEARDLLRLALTCVGRGGEGDMGQRIRDEILVIQSRNQAKVPTAKPPSPANRPGVLSIPY